MTEKQARKKKKVWKAWAIICPYTKKPSIWGHNRDQYDIYPSKKDAELDCAEWIKNDCDGYKVIQIKMVPL